jgi:O-antigen ligase
MGSVTSSATPLLSAFRASNSSRQDASTVEPWFATFLTILACLIPVAACWYLGNSCPDATPADPCILPLFSFRDVEFTHPDLVAGLAVLAVFARGLIKGFHPLPKILLIPFGLFFLSTILSTVFAIDKVHGVAALIQEIEFMALAWAFSLLTEAKTFLRIVQFILAFFMLQTVIAVWQFVVLDAEMPTGTFTVHQQYAFYTSFAAVMAFALVSNETGRAKRWYIVTLAILLVGSLLGLERAPWLSFVVGAFAVAWYSGRKKKRLVIGCVVTVLAAALLVAIVPRLRDLTIARISEAEEGSANKNYLLSRLVLWKVAFDLFTQNPVLGIGPKNFQVVVTHYASLEDLQGYTTIDPHNVWVGTLAEQGIIGFLTYAAFCWGILRLGTSRLRNHSFVGLPRSLCLVYTAYFFFWLTMSYPFFQKGTGHIDFLLIGLIVGLNRNLAGRNSSSSTAPALSGVSDCS